MSFSTGSKPAKHPIALPGMLFLIAALLIQPAVAREDVYDINPLSALVEAQRTVELMGGPEAVRAAADAAAEGSTAADWAWSLKLTSLLLELDPQDERAQAARAIAARSLAGQASSDELREQYQEEAVALSGKDLSTTTGDGKAVDEAISFDWLYPAADPWNVNKNYASFSIADADWTIDEVFPGTKLIFDGRYAIRKGPGKPSSRSHLGEYKPIPDRMVGTIGAHLQWGEGETELEYARLYFTTLAHQRVFTPRPGNFKPLRDSVEWLVIQGGQDDPLGINYYGELTLVRAARTWYWQPSRSAWLFTVGASGSAGYAWAESTNELYKSVSNPIIGGSIKLAVNHPRWGHLYTEQRVVDGFTLSSPARGGAVSREARFRFGYITQLYRCLSLELFVEKRSFNFADPERANLYTKSRRTGLALGCAF
jgi:hypothetical protein